MRVKIIKTDKRLGVKKGEIYNAFPYWLDPTAKLVLDSRVPDGYKPYCTHYSNEVEIIEENSDG